MEDERLDDLIARHFEDLLEQGEERELARALNESPAARARMASFMRMEGATARLANANLIGAAREVHAKQSSRRVRSRRLARPTQRWPAYAAAAACVAVAAFLYFQSGSSTLEPVLARLTSDSPGLRVTRGQKTWTADKGLELQSGDLLLFAQPASLKIANQETSLDADAGAEFSVTQTEHGVRVNLKHGTLSATVAPQPPGKPMIFETPHANAEVLGTRLALICNGDTRLEVQHGRVRLTRHDDGKSVDVGAGYFAMAGHVQDVVDDMIARPVTAVAAVATHSQTIRAVAFMPDGKSFLCAGNAANAQPTIVQLDTETQKPIASYPADIGTVLQMDVSPDGKILACAMEDQSVKLFDTVTRKYSKIAGTCKSVRSLQFSPNGAFLTWCGGKQIHVWDIKTQTELKLPQQDSDVLSISVNANSILLASGDAAGNVKIWNMTTESVVDTLPPCKTGIVALSYSRPKGTSLAVGSQDTTVSLWYMVDKTVLRTNKEFQSPRSFVFGLEGKIMIVGCDDGILRYWNQPQANVIEEESVTAHRAALTAIAITADNTLATAAADGELKLWKLTEGVIRQSNATLHPFGSQP